MFYRRETIMSTGHCFRFRIRKCFNSTWGFSFLTNTDEYIDTLVVKVHHEIATNIQTNDLFEFIACFRALLTLSLLLTLHTSKQCISS